MMEVGNYYEILSLEETATPTDIKSAYRSFMKDHHPDLNPGAENEELCRLASEAYSVLKDEDKRSAYDRSLHEEPALDEEEDWAPSWGEEEAWTADEVFADVVEEEVPSPQPAPDEPIFENEPTFGTEDRISNLPPVKVPEEIKTGKINFRSLFPAAALAVVMMVVAPLVAFVTHPAVGFLSAYSMLAIPVALVLAIVYTVKWELKHRLPWWLVVGLPAGIYGFFTFMEGKASPDIANFLFPALMAACTTFVVLPTVRGYFEDRKLLKPRVLKKSNSFGEVSGTVAEELLETVLNPLWDIKGLRCFRMRNEGFSHMLVFHNKVVLLKPAYLHHEGVLKFSGPTLMNRFSADLYQPVLEPEYITSVMSFTSLMPKQVKVYPVIVAVPVGKLRSFEKDDRAAIVASEDAAAFIADILLKNETKNVVDHTVVLQAFRAAHGVKA